MDGPPVRNRKLRAVNEKGHSALNTVGGCHHRKWRSPRSCGSLLINLNAREKLFDLADYLTWRASGVMCLYVLVCKWNLDADSNGARWNDDFLESVGLAST